jgi:hypothetical protein
MTRIFCRCVLTCALACLPTLALAQDGADGPVDTGRYRFKAIRFTPSVLISNVGVDSNVFNAAGEPEKDFTAGFGPAVNLWMNVGPSQIVAKTGVQYLYFHKFAEERSWNSLNEMRWTFPLARFTPFVDGRYTTTRERPNYEIDARTRQRDTGLGFGTDVRLSGRSSVRVTAARSEILFVDEDPLAASLSDTLDRRTDVAEAQFRYKVTPLTTFVVRGGTVQDRFLNETVRDSNSFRIVPGVELKPFALISGSAFVGVRHFNGLSSALPDYQGMVASVDARYVMNATQFHVKVARDLEYSYETTQPYYALQDATLSVTQRITHTFDVVGRGGRQLLNYKNVTPTSFTAPNSERVDKGQMFGAGVGYRLGETLRFGFDVDHYERRSPLEGRSYSGFRAGGSIGYGLP